LIYTLNLQFSSNAKPDKALFKVILQIQRVQNRTLYQQYQLKKRFLEEQKPTLPNGWPLERDLWHGTLESNTDSIAMHGFNRSYCGRNGMIYMFCISVCLYENTIMINIVLLLRGRGKAK